MDVQADPFNPYRSEYLMDSLFEPMKLVDQGYKMEQIILS